MAACVLTIRMRDSAANEEVLRVSSCMHLNQKYDETLEMASIGINTTNLPHGPTIPPSQLAVYTTAGASNQSASLTQNT